MGKKRKYMHPGTLSKSVSESREIEKSPSGINSMVNWLCVLVAILPLLISKKTIDSNLSVRFLFLSGFILAFLLYFFVRRKYILTLNSSWLKVFFVTSILFLVWNFTSLAQATNEQEGWFFVCHHVLNFLFLIIVMITVQKEFASFLRICKVIMLLSIVESYIGISQFYGWGFENLPGNYIPYGLMANRNLFGSAQALMLPFVMYTLFKGSKSWKYLSGVAGIGLIISLVLSQTRSAWLSALIIILGSLLLILIFIPQYRKKWAAGTVIGLAGIILIVFLLLAGDTEGILRSSVKERTELWKGKTDTTISNIAAAGITERIKVWKTTLKLIRDHPVTGVGPGNWKIMIPAYTTADMVWAGGHYVPDQPHNVYLNVAAEYGIPGAILYFLPWIIIGILGFKLLLAPINADNKVFVILLLTGLAGFASDSFFSFPDQRIEHSLYMTLMSGIILGLYNILSPKQTASKNWFIGTKKWNTWMVAISAFCLFIGSKRNSFDSHMIMAKTYQQAGDHASVIEETKKGKNSFTSLNPDGEPLEMMEALAYDKQKNFPEALRSMNIASRLAPHSPVIYNNLGTIYTDMKDYNKAIENYNKAIRYAPKFEMAYKNLAVNYYNIGNDSACINALSKVNISNEPVLVNLLNDAKKRIQSKQPN